MPIYAPGRRDRHNRPLRSNSRSVVAMLSLTAMVDMFTVLVVFLLQNYNTTGEAIDINEKITLPKASAVRELKPAHVVVISRESILLNKDVIATFAQVKEQADWTIQPLATKIQERFKEAEEKSQALAARIRTAVDETRPGATPRDPLDDRRVTVQADKSIDFLTVKKVMYTLSEAGASEINFAVLKKDPNAAEEGTN